MIFGLFVSAVMLARDDMKRVYAPIFIIKHPVSQNLFMAETPTQNGLDPVTCNLSPTTCLARTSPSRYSVLIMMDEKEFQKRCDAAFETLRRRLQEVGDERGFEVEGGSGKLEIQFEDADETRFVISPQTPVRQIWISALTTSFKLSWSDAVGSFVLEKTGETLMQLMGRILSEQLGSPVSV
jgi:iron donor protein CyaY